MPLLQAANPMRSSDDVNIDWDALRQAAHAATKLAYVPYSGYPVGAAAIADDGRLVSGCNIENAGYGVTLCAECSLVSQLFMTGGGRIRAFVCVNGDGDVIMPCGRCRQLLFEHSDAETRLLTVSGIRTMGEVLPDGFGPRDLDDYRKDAQ